MHRFSLPLLCLLLPAFAQESIVVTLFVYSWDEGLAASVISADPTATTYSIGCPSGQGSTCLGYGNGIPTITIVGGPSTAVQTLVVEEGEATIVVTCQLTATSPYGGPCVRTDRSGMFSQTTSFGADANSNLARFEPITVTGGLEKLQTATTGSGGGDEGGGESLTGTESGATDNGIGAVRVGASIFGVGFVILWGSGKTGKYR
ncbi:hypothetical protein MMYC01_206865 [Madurella mycetomatis]|uniref:Uncharacterized protein n=1 Tax=Madurella mycetomatis TaxID=100816 RepID=A0A175VZT0_9PEZI|nr:hypothetical protein MMYC01_206865 [Madurella mycetomatis]